MNPKPEREPQNVPTQLAIAMARANKIAEGKNEIIVEQDPPITPINSEPLKKIGEREYTEEEWGERQKEIVKRAIEKGQRERQVTEIKSKITEVMNTEPASPQAAGGESIPAFESSDETDAEKFIPDNKPEINIKKTFAHLEKSPQPKEKRRPEIVKVKGSDEDWTVVDFSPLDQVYRLKNGKQQIKVGKEEVIHEFVPLKPGKKVVFKGSSSVWRVREYDGYYYHLTKKDNYGGNRVVRVVPEDVSLAPSWWEKKFSSSEQESYESFGRGTVVRVNDGKELWTVDDYFPETNQYDLSKKLAWGTYTQKFDQKDVSQAKISWFTKIKSYFTKASTGNEDEEMQPDN